MTVGEQRVLHDAWTKIRKMENAVEDGTLEDDGTLKAFRDLYKLANNLAGKARDLESRVSSIRARARQGIPV